MSDRNPIPLDDKIVHRDVPALDRDWLAGAQVEVQHLSEVLEQSTPPPDLLDVPAAKQIIDEERERAHELGFDHGMSEAGELLERMTSSLSKVDSTIDEACRVNARTVVEMALVVAEGLLGKALQADDSALEALVHNCLHSVAGSHVSRIELNPEDLAMLGDKLTGTVDAGVVTDCADLQRGECRLQTAESSIDARLRPRLDSLREELIDILREAEAHS